jgi:hypothetical protein
MACPRGNVKQDQSLLLIPGTVCFGCYAKRGFYTMYKGVKAAQYKRLKSITQTAMGSSYGNSN